MLTVLPVSSKGVSYGIWVLKSLVKRYEDNVVAIIQIGGEEDSEKPYSTTSFIVLLMDGFNFTAFVSHLGTMPEREDYSGTGSQYYDEFREFVMKFQGEETGVPGLFSDNSREVSQYGLKAKCTGFSWSSFFFAASKDLDFDNRDEELSREFFSDMHDMDWLMNVYRVFLINSVFTHLWEVIS